MTGTLTHDERRALIARLAKSPLLCGSGDCRAPATTTVVTPDHLEMAVCAPCRRVIEVLVEADEYARMRADDYDDRREDVGGEP